MGSLLSMESNMKKIVALLTVLGISLATISPASAWYRGGWGGYYGGWGPGAAIGAGIAGALDWIIYWAFWNWRWILSNSGFGPWF